MLAVVELPYGRLVARFAGRRLITVVSLLFWPVWASFTIWDEPATYAARFRGSQFSSGNYTKVQLNRNPIFI